jgi:hypothetical protein
MAALKLSGRDQAELGAILGVDPRRVDVREELIRLADKHAARECGPSFRRWPSGSTGGRRERRLATCPRCGLVIPLVALVVAEDG